MEAFNHAHEKRRISEKGLSYDETVESLADQYWSLLAERTGVPNNFTLEADLVEQKVGAVGFEHRGDLSVSYQKSVDEAKEKIIADRFKLENDGYEAVKKYFFDVPLYSTVVLFSPPPKEDMQEFGYGKNTGVYFYHILPGAAEHKRTIKSLTWMNEFDEEDSAEILNGLIGDKIVEPTESSILFNPVAEYGFTPTTESLQTIWGKIEERYNAKLERTFTLPPYELIREYLLHGDEIKKGNYSTLSAVIDGVAKRYAEGKIDEEFQRRWKIMLNLADQELLHKDTTDIPTKSSEMLFFPDNPSLSSDIIFHRLEHLNEKPREASGSCGKSGGESFLSNPAVPDNSVALTTKTFEISQEKETWDYHEGDCVVCNAKNTEVGPCNICKTCEKTFD